MAELESGEIVKLKVEEKEGSKWILTHKGEEISLNASEAPEDLQVDDKIEVFLFVDRRGNLSATTQLPHITKGTYGWARVIKVTDKEGAFVDIGTSKEVQVKAEDLPKVKELWPVIGDHLYMTLRTDKEGELFGRLATEDRVEELYIDAPTTLLNKNVQARAYRLLPIGSFLLSVPENYRIFVHQSERVEEPRLGQDLTVRIIDTKEDGSLNGSLLPRKHERLGDDAESIFRYLNDVGGRMPFTDKSTPEEIQEMFTMSKAAFKRALGKLMKEGKIVQNDGWTEVKM
ncbi:MULTISPECIES: S1-like domain-containing RNA-binding protein [Bacillaceae]|uniref:CvfB family protein n=1 Tax=Bacillaceae TaxID=186817 RepID=UPI000AF8762E|nr:MULTISPECIES: S1-like domain-containing RNA-binding protein [Bacillaceae]MDF2065314.1 S1-like domain-containing RNA-binding protein [Bacillus sp. Cr_A10]